MRLRHTPRGTMARRYGPTTGGRVLRGCCLPGEEVEVAEFDSPRHKAEATRTISLDETEPFQPTSGDRCLADVFGEWQPVRFIGPAEHSEEDYVLDLDGECIAVPALNVRFRRLAPLRDPLAELGDKRTGDGQSFGARADFQRYYWELAGFCHGLSGAMSAAVNLHPHQIGVARRVLSDPVQRYLLADEVGLGKTIEAGFVIRQRLIDAPAIGNPRSGSPRIGLAMEAGAGKQVCTQRSLHGAVEIASFDEERSLRRVLTPDLVVIDEAHRIAAGFSSQVGELSQRYEAVRELAHQVPRLLLLSATPALHHEEDLLAMLHLLDPDTYQLEDLEAFQARVGDREQIGELFLAIRPGAPEFLIKSRLPDLVKAFRQDKRMQALAKGIERALGDDKKAGRGHG